MNNNNQDQGRELGWDDPIEKDGGSGFVLLPAGDYDFTVSKFERARFAGSDKMPPCNQAKLELTVHSREHGDTTVQHNLFLHTKTEGLISNFFSGIGLKKKGEAVKPMWNSVVGRRGRLKLEVRNYTHKGEERSNNQVKTFYAADDLPQQGGQNSWSQPPQNGQYQTPTAQGQQQGGWSQTPQQGGQQQPWQGQQQGGGWSPGNF